MQMERLTPGQTKRYLAKISFNRTDDDYWLWQASFNACGYGIVGHNGRTWLAHKLMWHWVEGPVPKGNELDHICRNRACVRPSHLQAVTHKVNMRTSYQSLKTHCPKGHPYAGENLVININGGRICRTCRKVTMNAANWRRRHGQTKR